MYNLVQQFKSFIIFVSILLLLATHCVASDNLDVSFGSNGVVITDFGIGDDEVYGLTVQADGKIIVAGFSYNGAVKNMAVARYLENGDLDPSFSNDGKNTFSLGTGDTIGRAIVLQDDGKIVVVGSTVDLDNNDFAIVRLTDDGELDGTFGTGGKTTLSTASGNDIAYDVKIDEHGAIFVVGTTVQNDSSETTTVVKIDTNGGLDTAFGSNGIASISNEGDVAGRSFEILSDGSLLVAGYRTINGLTSANILKLSSTGSIESGFGTSGQVTLVVDDHNVKLFDVLVLADNNIVCVGYYHNGSYREPFIARLDGAGFFDTSFGDDGYVHIDLGYDAVAYSAALQKDDSVLLTGFGLTPENKDMILVEVDKTGSEITYLVTDIASQNDESRALMVLGDGLAVTAGSAGGETDTDFALVKYSTTDMLELTQLAASGGVTTGSYTVETLPITSIAQNSAAGGGHISGGNSSVTARGVCYSIVPYPVYRVDSSDDDTDTADSTTTETSVIDLEYEVVRSGQTSDGTGIGVFGSDIHNVTPGTLYYVRAYAVLSDSSVIYGNQVSFETTDACFIATAAFGSILDKHVVVLREFRDKVLKKSELGNHLVGFYYHYSPVIADKIKDSEFLKKVTRTFLLPVIGVCYFLLHGSLVTYCLAFVFLISVGGLLTKIIYRKRELI